MTFNAKEKFNCPFNDLFNLNGRFFGTFSLIAKGAQAEPKSGQQQVNDNETLLGALLDIDPNEAKDQACPLNGQYYTLTEKNAWSSRRPLFVMIENTPDARPQSGLSKADVVFEAVAEGGVTRFGALYYCAAQYQDVTLAPVRSARSYFVDWASGFNLPMYVHVGGANLDGPADALAQIGTYGWRGENDIDQFSVGYPTFVRNYNRIPGRELRLSTPWKPALKPYGSSGRTRLDQYYSRKNS